VAFCRLREVVRPLEVLVAQQGEQLKKLDTRLERLTAAVVANRQQNANQHFSLLQLAIFVVLAGAVNAVLAWAMLRRPK
jgi:type II secretory pathway component PulF